MKTLYESILNDINTQIKNGGEDIIEQIKQFLKNTYKGTCRISKKPNKEGFYEVSGERYKSYR